MVHDLLYTVYLKLCTANPLTVSFSLAVYYIRPIALLRHLGYDCRFNCLAIVDQRFVTIGILSRV